jgi:hypothetical protein
LEVVSLVTHHKTSKKTNRRYGGESDKPARVGRFIDGMDAPERNILVYVMAVMVMGSLLLMLGGMLYFVAYPNAMNEPVIPDSWHVWTLIILFGAGLALLVSLWYNRKDLVAWRVGGFFGAWGLMAISYIWWFITLPFLF